MKKANLFIVALLFFAVAAATVWAEVPTMINYQGRLLDAAGDPVADGPHNVEFRIYDETSTQRWFELELITTTDGLFSTQLGTFGSPLHAGIFDYPECWLGITILGEPELTPRARLITVPYAHRVSTVDGAEGGTIMGDLDLGDATSTGSLEVYMAGSASPVISLDQYNADGGDLDIRDENGTSIIWVEADGDGEGGFVNVKGGSSSEYFRVDGDYNGTGDPRMSITGSASEIDFNTDQSGDNSVVLPTSSINSFEMFNEPGLASESSNPNLELTTDMQDVETVSITVPTSGFILVQGQYNLRTHGSTSTNYVRSQIDEASGGGAVSPYYTNAGWTTYPNTSYHYDQISVQRVYFKNAGTYTFRLEAQKSAEAGHTCYAYRATVTAIYIPTSYESIKSYVSSPAGFDNAVPVEMMVDDEDPSVTETMYEVDLRELELRASRAREAALKAERDLYKAQSQQNEDARSN